MKAKVIGFERKQGEYQGRPYDNCYLHIRYKKQGVVGSAVESVKVKSGFLAEICAENEIVPDQLVGRDVVIYYNRYGQLEQLELCASDTVSVALDSPPKGK